MKVIITGGCGFIGHHLIEHFYKNTDWDSGDVFKMVNKVLKDNNNYTIEWLDGTPF